VLLLGSVWLWLFELDWLAASRVGVAMVLFSIVADRCGGRLAGVVVGVWIG
jgi:hypothetical protein